MKEKNRVEKWDIVKAFLIFTVVLGHLCDKYTADSASMRAAYFFIYIFHMPLFLFISGMFSKSSIDQKRYGRIFSYLVLYYLIKILIWLPRAVFLEDYSFSLLSENSVPWYAFALFVFCLVTIALRKFSPLYVMTAAVVFACFAGYDSSVTDELVLSRIIAFYPFFLAGYYLDGERVLRALSGSALKIISLVLLTVLAAFVFLRIKDIYWIRPLLTGKNPFRTLGAYAPYGGLLRLLYYGAAFAVGAMVIAVLPAKLGRGWISGIGRRSVQIFSLHWPVTIILYEGFHLQAWLERIYPAHYKLLLLPLALLITLFCSLKLWEKPFQLILHPKGKEK